MPEQIFIGVDPGLGHTGFAALRGDEVLAMDVFRAPKQDKRPAWERADGMAQAVISSIEELDEVCDYDLSPCNIVIEMASQHGPYIRNTGGGAGLGVHGECCGIIYERLRRQFDIAVLIHPVRPEDWTRGVPKEKRAERLAWLYPEYRDLCYKGKDQGLDIADALGLAKFGQDKQHEAKLLERTVDV